MGQRTCKRVPLDFVHPIGEVWPGFLSPDPRPCPAGCQNGSTVDGRWLHAVSFLIGMVGSSGVNPRPLHPFLEGIFLAPSEKPTAAWAEISGALAGRPPDVMGHDAIDVWSIERAILSAAGLDEKWGNCPTCHGHACHPDDIDMNEDWEPTEPPEGDGWQLWETTSEGSPVSPVFGTAEALADWSAVNATVFASQRASRDEWLQMFLTDTTVIGSMMIVRLP